MDETSAGSSTYVYGIVSSADLPTLRQRGVEKRPVRTVVADAVSALVSDLATVPVPTSRANLIAHSDVLQEAVQTSTVLPMRFGFVMDDDDVVREDLLELRRGELEALLSEMAGRVEMSVKAYYLEDAVLTNIVTENPAIADLREATRKLPGDAGYYQRIRLGQLIASAIERKRAHDSEEIIRRLDERAAQHVRETAIPEQAVVKASFLVNREEVDAFRQLVFELAEQKSRLIQFTCLGPLPPYSFAELGARPATAATR